MIVAFDAVTDGSQLLGKTRMERGLKISFVPHKVLELPSFPAILYRVESSVKSDGVAVKVRIRNAVHGTGSAMDEFTPDHIAGLPILACAVFAHADAHGVLHLAHRFVNRLAEGVHDSLVPSQLVGERDRLGGVKSEIVE